MNDNDRFVLTRAQIIDLIHECGGIEADGPDLINFILNDKYKPLPETSTHVLYAGSDGAIAMKELPAVKPKKPACEVCNMAPATNSVMRMTEGTLREWKVCSWHYGQLMGRQLHER